MEESKVIKIHINDYTQRTKLAEILLNNNYMVSYKIVDSGSYSEPDSIYLIATKLKED